MSIDHEALFHAWAREQEEQILIREQAFSNLKAAVDVLGHETVLKYTATWWGDLSRPEPGPDEEPF